MPRFSTLSSPTPARRLLAGCLIAAAVGSPAVAQKLEAFSNNAQRESTQVIWFSRGEAGGFDLKGAASIHYGAPQWKPEYAGMLRQKSSRHRLGKDGWTTLDSNVAFDVGGKTIPAGSYYLLLEVTDEPGTCNLILLDAAKIRAAKQLPGDSSEIEGGLAVPLRNEQPTDDEDVAKLRITLSADEKDAKKTRLELRWGTLMMVGELQAKVDAAD